MNAYEKAQSLSLSGTDAEKVATLKATGVTARSIVLSELLFLLNFRGMLTKLVSNNADEKWTGTVLAMKAAIAADPVATAHVDRWLSHITNPRNTHWDTTDSNYSAPFWAMAQAVAGGSGMPSAADFSAVAALGGGWLFADLTVEQFAAEREAAEAVADRQSIIDACLDPISAAHAAAATKLNNAQASLGPEHTDGLTLEELHARCDAITASEDGTV
jgi:hypothetical protein